MITEFAVGVILSCYIFMPSVCLKDNVIINGAHFDPVMVRIINVARETAPPLEGGTVWITSANDSEHMEESLHYENLAFDIRIRNIVGIIEFPLAARAWAEQMRIALGDDYEVILEDTHLHVEYDPDTSGKNPIWGDAGFAEGFNLRIK